MKNTVRMKHIFRILLLYFIVQIFSINPAISRLLPIEYQLFEEQGKQGLKDNSGNVLISARYDELGWSKGYLDVVKDVVGYRQGQKWGLINLKNEPITGAIYTQLYLGNKGLLIAAKKSEFSPQHFIGVLTTGGKEVLPFKYTSVKLTGLRAIVSGKEGRRYKEGVIDLNGKVVIPQEYKDITCLGNLRFAVKNFEGKIAIYNDTGKQVTGFELDSISSYKSNFAMIYDNHLTGLIDVNGRIIESAGYKDFKISPNGVKARSFDEWYMIKGKNNIVATFHYDEVIPFDQHIMQVKANGKTWLINNEGKALTPQHYDELYAQENGYTTFKHHSKWGILDNERQVFMPAQFDSLFLKDNMIYAREKIEGRLKWSLYDAFGMKKSSVFYDHIGEKTNYLYPVSRQGYWGYINRSGEEVIHCVYNKVSAFVEGLAAVKFHQEYGIIDKQGEWVVLPQKFPFQVINDEYYLIRNGRLTTLKSIKEGTIYFTKNEVEVKDNYLLEYPSGEVWKIDFNGRVFNGKLGSDKYQEVRPPSEGFYAVKIDGKYGFVDEQNRLRVANRYDEVGPFKEGMAAIKLLGRWGYIDKRERLIIQPAYNHSSEFENGIAIVTKDSGVGLINSKGDKISSFDHSDIHRLANGRFLVEKSGKYGLMDVSGKRLLNAKYEELEDLNNGHARVKLFGKYGLIDLNGVDVIPVIYDHLIYDNIDDCYLAMKKSGWENVRLP